jgi:antitoxin CcdA
MPARAARRPTNLSLDEALVAEARALKLNLSRVVEASLRDAVATERRRQWLEENAGALAAYERFVETHGIFNEDERDW